MEAEEAAESGPVRTHLPTDFSAVRLSEAELRQALTHLLLEVPLRVASSPSPLCTRRGLLLASAQPMGNEWLPELAKPYGRYCERRGTPGDCLELFKDGSRFDARDKGQLALALAVGPAMEARDAELRGMFSTAQLWTTVSITLSVYLALLAAPEPVSKGAAAAFALLAWGYLGWELFDVVRGYLQLQEEAARATTFAELREAGERFGKVLGPNSVRILLMLGTAAVGSTGQLLSRAPKLPGFAQAMHSASSRGIHLLTAAEHADKVTVAVAVAEGTFSVVLPANAFSMAARGTLVGESPRKDKVEVHHIATTENNKSGLRGGPWTPRFKEFFDKAGMSMNDPANKVSIGGHRGPHPQAYHQEVYKRLREATAHCQSTLQCKSALVDQLRSLALELKNENSRIYKLLTRGAPR
jgi:hypothetical protein